MSLARKLAAVATTVLLATGIALAPAITASAVPSLGYYAGSNVIAFGDSANIQVAITSADKAVTFYDNGAVANGPFSISSTGLITGRGDALGQTAFSFSAEDASGRADGYQLTVQVVPKVTSRTLPTAIIGQPYSATIDTAPASTEDWMTIVGTLPPGLEAMPGGVIAGTPTAAALDSAVNTQQYDFTVSRSVELPYDSLGAFTATSRTVPFSITVQHPAPVVTTTSLPGATVGQAYSAQLTASGNGTLSYAATGLPAGLSLDAATGIISGTPSYNLYTATTTAVPVTVAVFNATRSADAALSIAVATPGPSLDSVTLPNAVVGQPYNQTLAATSVAPVSYALMGGLPAGLSLSPSGVISGTPSYLASYGPSTEHSAHIRVTGLTGAYDDAVITITLLLDAPTLVTDTLQNGWLTQSYDAEIVTTGPGAVVGVSGLPAGLGLVGGHIVGTPGESGVFKPKVTVTNGAGTVSEKLRLVINPAPVFTTTELGAGIVGTEFDEKLQAEGKDRSFQLVGAVPAGLTMNANGRVRYTPTAEGDVTFQVRVSNPSGSELQTFTIESFAVPAITTTALGGGTVGTMYWADIVTTGRDASLTVSAGELPRGLSLSGDGSLTGVPSVAGSSTFELTASNAAGAVSASYTVSIVAPAVAPATGSTPKAASRPLIVPPVAPAESQAAESGDAETSDEGAEEEEQADENLPTLSEPSPEATAAEQNDGPGALILWLLGGVGALVLLGAAGSFIWIRFLRP